MIPALNTMPSHENYSSLNIESGGRKCNNYCLFTVRTLESPRSNFMTTFDLRYKYIKPRCPRSPLEKKWMSYLWIQVPAAGKWPGHCLSLWGALRHWDSQRQGWNSPLYCSFPTVLGANHHRDCVVGIWLNVHKRWNSGCCHLIL